MVVPSAASLFAGKNLAVPRTLRGVYVDRRVDQQVRARFAYRAPNSYSWFDDDRTTGFVTARSIMRGFATSPEGLAFTLDVGGATPQR